MSNFETTINPDIVCPYCFHTFKDSYEYGDESFPEGEECPKCNNRFHYTKQITVEYETRPDCTLNGKEHVEKDFFNNNNELIGIFCDVCDKFLRNVKKT